MLDKSTDFWVVFRQAALNPTSKPRLWITCGSSENVHNLGYDGNLGKVYGSQKYIHCRNAFKKYLAEQKENLGFAEN